MCRQSKAAGCVLHASYLLPAIYRVCNKPQYNSPSLLFELQQFKLLTAFLWLGSLGDAPGDAPTPCLMLVSLKWCRTGHAGGWHAGCEVWGWQHGRTAHGTARLCPTEHQQISKLTSHTSDSSDWEIYQESAKTAS